MGAKKKMKEEFLHEFKIFGKKGEALIYNDPKGRRDALKKTGKDPGYVDGKAVKKMAVDKGKEVADAVVKGATDKGKAIVKGAGDMIKKHGVRAGVAGATIGTGMVLAKRLAKKSDDKKDKNESFSNWRDELSKDHEEINELLGAAVGGTIGGALAGTAKGAGLLAKAGIKNKIAQKAVGGAVGSAAGEVLDPTKKGKDKKPLTAAALGGLGGAVAGGGIGAAEKAIKAGVKKMKKEEVEAVDENAGPSTPVSMSGGKLQFNKGGAGIGKIRPKKGGSLAGAPIPRV